MKLLGLSITFNLVLAFMFYRSQTTVAHLKNEIERNIRIYSQDIATLEVLLKDRLSINEIKETFGKQTPPLEFFEKPTENGIGASHLFFYFKDQRLERIQKYDFAEK